MRPLGGEWYIGIDLGVRWTQVSCYYPGLPEPETKSTVAGKEMYRIPTALCRQKKTGRWCFGEEAGRLAESGEGMYADYLLSRAEKGEAILLDQEYQAGSLLQIFLWKVIQMALPPRGVRAVTKCVFTVGRLTEGLAGLLLELSGNLGFLGQQVLVQDSRESFYAYAVSQDPALWNYDVMLYSCEEDEIWQKRLVCNRKTRPKVAVVEESCLGKLPEEVKEWDAAFARLLRQTMAKKIVSAVYLTGSGFEGNWMDESLQVVCQGKRAFQGKNLFTKGACYAGMLMHRREEAETVYFCEYKMTEHIFLKITSGDEEGVYFLVEAGDNCHQVAKSFRILTEKEAFLDLWVQGLDGRGARIERLNLPGLENAKSRRNRLEVSLWLEGDAAIVKIKDIGWGDLQPGTGLDWEFEIGLAQS